jgi:LacI family transcriptional regulator
MVADLLVGHGHRRIGAVFGPRDTSTGSERANAFRQRLVELGNPLDERLVRSGPFSESTGRAALADLATGPAPPTALFCGNDVIAFGVLNAARSLSIQVPAQLTVIGFDDIPMSAWPVLDLSTVSVDLSALASRAAGQLALRMTSPGSATRSSITLPPRLQLRGTHGNP